MKKKIVSVITIILIVVFGVLVCANSINRSDNLEYVVLIGGLGYLSSILPMLPVVPLYRNRGCYRNFEGSYENIYLFSGRKSKSADNEL